MIFAGRGAEKARGDKRIRPVFGGASESGLKDFRWNLRLFPLVLALLLLCTHSWGSCTTRNTGTSNTSVTVYSKGGDCSGFPLNFPRGSLGCTIGSGTGVCDGQPYNFTISCQTNSGGYGILLPSVRFTQVPCNSNCTGTGSYRVYFDYTTCDTQAEADSAYCALNPTAEGCVEEDVPPSCQADYQQCVGLGGVWKKISSSNTECASQCNTCENSAGTRFRNTQVDICCRQGLAPPDSAVQCYMPVNSGSGMTWSTRLTAQNDEGYSCGQLSTASGEAIQENQALYKRFCIDGERYEEQVDTNDVGGSSSSGAEGNSSSEDIGHSFGTELEALGGLYGVLDTIRDTLVKRLTPATEEIRDCLYNFKLCTALEPLQIDWTGMPQDTSMLQIDTAILKHIKPMMDSSVKLDSAQLKVLKQLDSLYKRGLVNDTDMVQAVNAIKGDVNDVESAVKGVKHGIDSLIDSMTTYMDKVGQGLGAVGDSIGALRGDFNGFLEGEGTVPGDTTWDGYSDVYDEGSDSIGNSYLMGLGGQLDSAVNDTAFDRIFAPGGGTSGPADSARLPTIDSMQRVLDSSIVAQRSELEDTLHAAFDSLKDEFMLLDYDSLILAPLGVRVPNTNTCPDHCFTFDISGENSNQSWLGDLGTLDFGFCRNLPGLGFDVFFLIRIIGRLFTAMFCIYIGLWFIAGRKN